MQQSKYNSLLLTSHATQPLDKGFYSPLNSSWNKTVRSYQFQHPGESFTKAVFASIFKLTWDNTGTVQNAIGGFRDSEMYPFDVNRVDMSKFASSVLWKSNQHTTGSNPTGDIEDTAILTSIDIARTDLTQTNSHQVLDNNITKTATTCSVLVEIVKPNADTSVIVDPEIIDWNKDLEVETDEAENMYITLPPLGSVGSLKASTVLPSCDQTQLIDKSVSLTSSWEQFHPEHKKSGEEEPNKDVANNKMSPAFDEVLSIPKIKSKTTKVSPEYLIPSSF